jgi:hypothetical protein
MIRHLILFSSGLLMLCSCSRQPAASSEVKRPDYFRQYRQGAVSVMVSLSETNLPATGKIQAGIEVRAPADSTVLIPELANFAEGLHAIDGYTEPPQRLPNDRQLIRRVWVFIPERSSKAVVNSLTIEVDSETIETDPVRIGIVSHLPGGTAAFAIKDIASPAATLPSQDNRSRSLYTVIGALLVLGLIPFIVRLSRPSRTAAASLPHETALLDLDQLPEDEVERIHELNRIFRTYYEARFNIPMVGRTVIEILPVLDNADIIHFLERCEEIRFSGKVPDGFAADAEHVVRSFVETTQEVPCD